jgi:hypothetical protein
MVRLITHDQALAFSRIGRMLWVCSSLWVVMFMDYLTSGAVGIISLSAGFICQMLVLKCWLDMIFKRKPGKNCWEFKE